MEIWSLVAHRHWITLDVFGRRLKSRENLADVLMVKDRIDFEGPEWKRRIYKRLRAMVEGSTAG